MDSFFIGQYMIVKQYIKGLIQAKNRRYTEDEILMKVLEKFPELDEEVLKHAVRKMIIFAKLRNLNSLYSEFTIE